MWYCSKCDKEVYGTAKECPTCRSKESEVGNSTKQSHSASSYGLPHVKYDPYIIGEFAERLYNRANRIVII